MSINRRDIIRAGILTAAALSAALTGVLKDRFRDKRESRVKKRKTDHIRLNLKANDKSDPILKMQSELEYSLSQPVDKRRWGMLIDLRKCIGCYACTVGCISENKLPPGVVYRPVITEELGKFPNIRLKFTPRPCMQCERPTCTAVCPVRATYKREDGIVEIDYDKCIGCRYCITACPYGARVSDFGESYTGDIQINQNILGGKQKYEYGPSFEYHIRIIREGHKSPIGNARKCHFCIHRVENGLLPICVTTCIGRATYFGDLNNPNSTINKIYNEKFLAAANKMAAKKIGEPSYTNATWLVEIRDGKPSTFVRASELLVDGKPLRKEEIRKNKDGKEYVEKFLVIFKDGKYIAFDPNEEGEELFGELFVNIKLEGGRRLKSALQIIKEEAESKSFEEWCKICELEVDDVKRLCEMISEYRDSCAIDLHRGPAQHSNGFYNVLSWMTVNILLGNIDHQGGMIKASTYDIKGKGKLFDLSKHPGKIDAFGLNLIRSNIPYEKTTLFDGYPAKRNYYPLASDVYEEIIPSAADQYTYPIKVLFLYMGSPVYSLPSGHKQIEALKDTSKIPLIIASDILIGTTSMYADYIFPDLSYLERWEFQDSHPNISFKVQNIRQPVISALTEKCTVFGNQIPISFEALVLKIAENLKLPGFGKDAFGTGLDFFHPDDMYLRMVANVAFGEKEDGSQNVPDASDYEIDIFIKSRSHIDKSVVDIERLKRIVGDRMYKKVIYVLNRGGRFEEYHKAFKDGLFTHPYGTLLNIYQEKTYKTIHSGTGKHHKGYACYIPLMGYTGKLPDELRNGYPLNLITNRTIVHTKSRTISNYYLLPLMPENEILVNSIDALKFGLKNGDMVKVTSSTNPEGILQINDKEQRIIAGKVRITETVKAGIITFVLGFGHWATGAADFEIDGVKILGDKRRSAGFHANPVMWSDPFLKNTCFIDPVGGSVGFYDTYVNLVKI